MQWGGSHKVWMTPYGIRPTGHCQEPPTCATQDSQDGSRSNSRSLEACQPPSDPVSTGGTHCNPIVSGTIQPEHRLVPGILTHIALRNALSKWPAAIHALH